MSARRLAPDEVQPDSFAFTEENMTWALEQMGKYPEGRQASAVIPLLWRAQEQEGWVSRPAIEVVAEMLDMPFIRVLEVATFYFMFHLAPVGKAAHFQVCGTTPCMLCGSERLLELCRKHVASEPHKLSDDGLLSWEEVECLGACSNAPVLQVKKDFYEDLTEESFLEILEAFRRGDYPRPGSRNGRYASNPLGAPTSLVEGDVAEPFNMAVTLALNEGAEGGEA